MAGHPQLHAARERATPRPLSRGVAIGGIGLAMLVLATGDLAEVTPGLEAVVASPIFPYIHESHDIAALILSLYIAHRVTTSLGLIAIIWFLAMHIPYGFLTFPDELPELIRLMLMTSAAIFGIGIIRVRRQLERQLVDQAMWDPLTGLLNHRHFHKELDYQLALARRYGERGAILFVDLDGFKAVNDQFGHQAGDELLKRVADLLQHHLRVTDSVARLGGDEFVALLPHTDVQQARMAANRFSQALGTVTVQGSFPVSASIGLVIYPDHGDIAERLLASADRAMYQAKEEGRNRLVVSAKTERSTPSAAHDP